PSNGALTICTRIRVHDALGTEGPGKDVFCWGPPASRSRSHAGSQHPAQPPDSRGGGSRSGYGPAPARRRRESTLHGPGPTVATYSPTKRKSVANSPPLRIGQRLRSTVSRYGAQRAGMGPAIARAALALAVVSSRSQQSMQAASEDAHLTIAELPYRDPTHCLTARGASAL